MNVKKYSLIILALSLGMGACEKESEPLVPPVVIQPLVKLVSPTPFQHYHPGNEVIISGEANAGALLHGYDLMVFDKLTGDTLFHDNGHTHSTRFTFSDTMIHHLPAAFQAQAYVKVYIDHDHNFVADSVDFYLLAQ